MTLASIRKCKAEIMSLFLKAGYGLGIHRGRVLEIFRRILEEERPVKKLQDWESRRSIAPNVIRYLTQEQDEVEEISTKAIEVLD